MRKLFVLIIGIVCTVPALQAQNKPLDLKEIMKGREFTGQWPEEPYWGFDSKTLYFRWNPENKPIADWYAVNTQTGKPYLLSDEELAKRMPEDYAFNPDSSLVCYTRNGDIYLFDVKTQTEKQICFTTEYESNSTFNRKGDKVIYQKGNDLFAWEINSGKTEQLTHIIKSAREHSGKSFAVPSEQERWLKKDRTGLFEYFKIEDAKQKAQAEFREKTQGENLHTINIGKAQIFGLQLSPDQRFITFIKMVRPEAKRTEVPNYVTHSGYVENEKSRPKVGSPQATFELVIFDRKENKHYSLKTEEIAGIKDWPKPYDKTGKGLRPITFSRIKYSPDGTKALLVSRSADNKDRWIMLLDLESGKPEVLNRQTDTAWIGGPGIGNYWPNGNFGWMPDGKSVWYQSEKTGYSHLYTCNIKTKKEKALTKGKFEIYDARLSKDKKHWYIVSNQMQPGVRNLYTMPLKGGEMKLLTPLGGWNDSYLSPDENYIAIRHSSINTPWEIYLQKNTEGSAAKQITHSQSEAYKSYKWRKPGIFTFKASDGADVYAKIYQPKESTKNRAAVIFVHGAGYLQNVGDFWSYYYHEMMFHNLLADKGYTVLDIDYRGSEGYGRNWRTGIYRHMGGKDLSDQVDAAKMLVEKYNIDPKRIGIYGGSYGGFITLMAMFTAGDVFKCGAALRSVTNWSNYNHGYTSNILNTPVSDPEAFKQSSPIYFAGGLKGHLLILHGMRDDNVQFQDVVDLNQRLIELGKTNWEMAVFPVERHGFKYSFSWYDEYRRILELFEKELSK